MSNINEMNPYSSLLDPISQDFPCGPDISEEQSFLELETLLKGKPETQFSEAIPPDWNKLHERCIQLLTLSKHIQPATYLTLAAMQLRGLEGLADGIEFLNNLCQKFWNNVYPLPDPDDNNSPIERLNLLCSFNTPMGSFGDTFRFIERLRKCPLTNSNLLGKFSLDDWEASHQTTPTKDSNSNTSKKPFEPPHIEAALRDTPLPWLQSQFSSLQRAKSSFSSLANFLASLSLSNCSTPDFSLPTKTLLEIEKLLSPFAKLPPPPSPQTQESSQSSTPIQQTSPSKTNSLSVDSREDVHRLLELILNYYKQNEPSSPVPLLLQRAKNLIDKDFLGAIEDLAPDALRSLRDIAGIKSS
ncbi:MAG: type VI secretion system protein TssA [Chthoniobacterales bacterium]|nr:type VI secretion system protein TssA [Chthoniobacterales bacterium]